MREIWKPVVGYDSLYEVSSMGRVRSLNYRGTKGMVKELSYGKVNDTYSMVRLYKDTKSSPKLVHRLVAQAFVPNSFELPQVNHKDENPDNNQASNLEWCSPKYNSNYGTRIKRQAKALSKEVIAIDLHTGKTALNFKSTQEAGRNGFTQSSVAACCRYERSHHKGFIWRYVDGIR